MAGLIWAIIVVLFVLWLLGFSLHIAGNLIFLLLVVAIIGVIYNLLVGGGRRHAHTTEVTEVERHDV
ncbi:MAG TPA: lmo0937 family membrane protein [Candidatus Dormibacteraeota bacterium]